MLKLPFPLRFAVVLVVFLVLIVVAVAIPALLLNYGLRLRELGRCSAVAGAK